MSSKRFVLLCAEEDDLALVQWVHAARMRGLAPEVVVGIEQDDIPLLDALTDVECAVFVVLRSENLDGARMRDIKATFARHRAPQQRLFALRVDYGAELAVDRIMAEIEGTSRPRSEISMVISLDDLTGPQPTVVAPSSKGPTVQGRRRRADRAAQAEVTAQFEVGDETLQMSASSVEAIAPTPAVRDRRGRTAPWIAGVGLIAALSTAAVFIIEPSGSAREVAPASAAQADAASRVVAAGLGATAEPVPAAAAAAAAAAEEEDAAAAEPVVIRVSTQAPAAVEPEAVPSAPRSHGPRRTGADTGSAGSESTTTALVPVVAAPLEPAPLEPAPLEPAPLEPAPLEPAPREPAPGAAPVAPPPVHVMPVEPAPLDR